jgi:NAD(P)-dependent dehydrogenase (short-subunit alcohol dehydrogenase family)
MGWSADQVGDLTGRTVVVTGANSGIGLDATRVLLAHGADVVLACRDLDRANAAAARLPGPGHALVRHLDLADLDSVRAFAEQTGEAVTDLVANAGVMAGPARLTAQGFELQMGTNHLGHALLTSLLAERLGAAARPRVVVVSSIAARGGRLAATTTREDLVAPATYRPQRVYSNTKQANLLFAQELSRRAAGLTVVAVHPGVSATELFPRQLRDAGLGALVPVARPLLGLVLQPASAGALPTLRGLVDPDLRGGEFIGPRQLHQARGAPELLEVYPQGADRAAAARLWTLTEEILGTPLPG